MSWNKKEDNRKSSFNLERFYDDLNRVQSSLGKSQVRKGSNSPYIKHQQKKNDRDDRQKDITAFKKEIAHKELLKTKIKLNAPYERTKNNYIEPKQSLNESRNFRMSELSNEVNDQDRYQRVRSKLMTWKRPQSRQHKNEEQKQVHTKKMAVNLYQNEQADNYLQKSIETPNNQIYSIAKSQINELPNQCNQKLQAQLTKRNNIYKLIERNINLSNSQNQKTESVDLSLKLQQHFRQYKMMQAIISQLIRVCGMNESTDLQSLYAFVKEDGSRSMEIMARTNSHESSEVMME